MNLSKIIYWSISLFGLFLLLGTFPDFEIYFNGKIESVKIIDKPLECYGTKVHHMMKVKHQNKVYIKKIGVHFCNDHEIGQTILMKVSPKYNRVLFPSESPWIDGISSLVIIILGFWLNFFYKKNSPPTRFDMTKD